MINALLVLLIFQLVGELLARVLALPLPGPVIGMLLLFIVLLIRGSVPSTLKETAQTILQHLALLFVPAGVGVMVYFALLKSEWLALLLTLIGSTILTMVVTAYTLRLLLSFTHHD